MNCVYSPVLCEEADDELFTHPCCVRRLMMNCVYSPVLCEEADNELCLLTRVV